MPYRVTRTIPELYRSRNTPETITVEHDSLRSATRHIGQVIMLNTGLTYIDHLTVKEIKSMVLEAKRKRTPQTWRHNPSEYSFEIEYLKDGQNNEHN